MACEQLTFAQLEQAWTRNGGSAELAPIMAAIALAESGVRGPDGVTRANSCAMNTNAGSGDYSVGAWQVNYFGTLLGPRTRAYGAPAVLRQSADRQAAAAVDIARGGRGLNAWTTYTSGAYRQFLPVRGATVSPSGSPASYDLPGPLPKIPTSPGDVFGLLAPDRAVVVRGLELVGGFLLVVVGLLAAARQLGANVPSGPTLGAQGSGGSGDLSAFGAPPGVVRGRARGGSSGPITDRQLARHGRELPGDVRPAASSSSASQTTEVPF